MSKFSVITVLAILIAGCIEHEPIPTTSKKITPISKDTLAVSEKLAGYTIYEGVIPCNNCLGISQKLLLKGDKKGVFRLTETYNKSGEELDPTVVCTGHWTTFARNNKQYLLLSQGSLEDSIRRMEYLVYAKKIKQTKLDEEVIPHTSMYELKLTKKGK